MSNAFCYMYTTLSLILVEQELLIIREHINSPPLCFCLCGHYAVHLLVVCLFFVLPCGFYSLQRSSWSYGSLIYDYPCNECLTPLIKSCSGEVFLIQHNVTKFDSDLRQVSGFLRVLWFPPSIKLTATNIWRYLGIN
jgi:hypothetical protein